MLIGGSTLNRALANVAFVIAAKMACSQVAPWGAWQGANEGWNIRAWLISKIYCDGQTRWPRAPSSHGFSKTDPGDRPGDRSDWHAGCLNRDGSILQPYGPALKRFQRLVWRVKDDWPRKLHRDRIKWLYDMSSPGSHAVDPRAVLLPAQGQRRSQHRRRRPTSCRWLKLATPFSGGRLEQPQ